MRKKDPKPPKPYDGSNDAERILENVMCRLNWTVETRDKLAECLEHIRRGTELNLPDRIRTGQNRTR